MSCFPEGDTMTARAEPCDCHGIPHRRLIIEAVADGETYTLLSICEWAYWLMLECCKGVEMRWPDYTRDVLAAVGLDPTEPSPEWRAILSAMDD